MRHADEGTLNAWLDGALPPGDAAAVAVHLEHCDACRARLGEAEHWRHAADTLLDSIAPGDVNAPPFQHVLERASTYPAPVQRVMAPYQPGQPLRTVPAWAAVAWAATILLALAVGYYAGEVYRPAARVRDESGRLRATASPQATPAAANAPAPTSPAMTVPAPLSVASPEIPQASGTVREYAGPGMRSSAPEPARERPLPEARGRFAAREADAAAEGVQGGRVPASTSPAAAAAAAAAPAAPAAAPTEAFRAREAQPESRATSNALNVSGKDAAARVVTKATADAPRRDVALKTADSALSPFADRAVALQSLVVTARSVEAAPTFTPFTTAPELLNREEARLALERFYPPMVKAAGGGGTTVVWLLVDTTGAVLRTQVKTPSGVPALDEAARRVASSMRFSPARNHGSAVTAWIQLPIVFKPTP